MHLNAREASTNATLAAAQQALEQGREGDATHLIIQAPPRIREGSVIMVARCVPARA
jgi:hypothetical protein